MTGALRQFTARQRDDGFVPSDLADLYAWYRAESETLSNGDPVSQANDLGPNGLHLTSTTTARPTLQTGVVNGRAVYRFDGSNDRLRASTASDWAFLSDGSSLTIFIVAYMTGADPDALYVLASTGRLSGNERGMDMFYDDRSAVSRSDQVFFSVSNGTGGSGKVISAQSANGALPPQTWHQIEVRHTAGAAGDDATLSVNETQVASDDPAGTFASTASNPLQLGAAAASNTFYSAIDVAELIICNAALSDTDRDAVRGYLAAEYGL